MLTVEEPKTKVCVVLSCGVDRLFALVELSIPSRLCGKRLREVANGFVICEITCLSTRWETGAWA